MEFVRKAIALNHTFIILIIVGIAFTCHNEWQEVEALEIGNQRIDEFRKEVNRIHIRLIEFSLLGETVLDWDETDLENYHAQRIALDSILCSFNVTHDMSVMIFGENGTGKEHIAHHLHEKSKRAGKPFVAVDCGSLSRELAPSAFFGHVKGAFTGADSTKKGYFHEAEGGTLFLDEVGNLALETQQMLLRAIQERRYRPIGDKSDRSFNVRIIAATNEDLEAAVSEKRFRQDLLYRLRDFEITVPPLRDCQEDIMPLAEFFREVANKELECNVGGFSSEARKALLTHTWPGNVRELRQKIMGAVLQAQEGVVTKEHLELAVTKPTSPVSFALRNDAEDKERIMRALKQTNGNRCAAAELLGISRTTLYGKLEEYGLKYKFRQP